LFSEEKIQMANKYLKKMFNTLSLKENASQNYTKIPSDPDRLATLKKTNNKCW
jgi:hypothetical protein